MTEPARPIRILLADDEAMIRAGVSLILRYADGIDVVADVADGHRAIEAAAAHQPDVVLLDIRMPGCDGLAAIGPLLALDPAPRVVMLTTFGDEQNVLRALRAGAAGFLLKDEGPQELISAVRAAAAGDAVLSPAVTAAVVTRMLREDRAAAQAPSPEDCPGLDRLTSRERDVLAMLGQGLSNHDIADRLGIGTGTVKTHVGAILEKTGSTSRVQAALLAHRAGPASRPE
ncbi:response regulator transcription factor [Streptomyces sp. NPDC126514]|uniref:response regulator transcription factor n=1 Tax=Streptomyces sp. NPDC126514 TaxID=3155210 RepID=UPI00331E1CF3